MGTRADFYLGRGEDMRWVGSVAWDGYPSGIAQYGFLRAKTEEQFLEGIAAMAAERDDFTSPEMGWPWPWADSFTTDYAYAFDDGRVCVSRETEDHSDWVDAAYFALTSPSEEEISLMRSYGPLRYPDMTDVQNVDFGSRSGLIVAGN
jgi:hypothetical protein